jgi:hypothetical protein
MGGGCRAPSEADNGGGADGGGGEDDDDGDDDDDIRPRRRAVIRADGRGLIATGSSVATGMAVMEGKDPWEAADSPPK